MSILGGIKTFFEKVGAEFEKLFGKLPSWAQSAKSVITYVAPLLETIVQLAAGSAAEAKVATWIADVQGDLATVSAIAKDGTPAPGSTAAKSAQTALSSINTNMAALLADADVKNSAKVNEIEAAVTGITGEISALLSGLSSGSPSSATGTAATPAS